MDGGVENVDGDVSIGYGSKVDALCRNVKISWYGYINIHNALQQ